MLKFDEKERPTIKEILDDLNLKLNLYNEKALKKLVIMDKKVEIIYLN